MTCPPKVWGNTKSDIANESDVFYGHSDNSADLRFSARVLWLLLPGRIRKLQNVGVISSCQETVGKGKARADLTQPLIPFSVSQVKVRCV